ncbi:MAG: glutamine synthetase family protein [Reyranellaceae bacterium]
MHFSGKTARDAQAWLEAKSIENVRVEWPDINGLSRGKVVPAIRFAELAVKGIQFTAVATAFDADTVPALGSGWGEENGFSNIVAKPDLQSLCVRHPGTAVAQVQTDFFDFAGQALNLSPRAALKNVLARLKARDLTARVAPEVELYLLTENGVPLGTGMPCYGLQNVAEQDVLLSAMIETLKNYWSVEGWHHEHGPGQFEFNVAHEEALSAADRLHFGRQALADTARRHGAVATFMAKPFSDRNGSACQLNVSLQTSDGKNAFHDAAAPDRLSSLCHAFIAGILERFDELALVFLPYGNSYKRIVPGYFAPVKKAWGLDNRTAAVRAINESEAATRIEFRVGGADIGAHFAIAALLAAGLDGIERNLPLAPVAVGNLEHQQCPSVASTWSEALSLFARSDWPATAFGRDIHRIFTKVKEAELQRYSRAVTDIDRNLYLRTI